MTYYNFNTAESNNYDLIPKGTIAKVRMQIQRGGLNDDEHGWTEGYATGSDLTGAVYLNCEYTILSGEYKGRKIWSTIGLYSSKNDNIWGDIGRSFFRKH